MQSQPLRGWKLGRITSNGVPRPKSIRAISAVESMEVGTLSLQLGSQVPSHLGSILPISTVESMEVGTYHFKWSPKFQVT